MAHKKTKSDIKSKLFLTDGLNEYIDWWYYWDYEDDDYYYDQCDDCGNYHCDGYCANYEYLPDELQPETKEYISKRGFRVTIDRYSVGRLIDMTTIYPKEVLRQKKIEAIFGGDYNIFDKKIYLKDLLNEKDKNILRKLDRN
jgi:hypothetical protein